MEENTEQTPAVETQDQAAPMTREQLLQQNEEMSLKLIEMQDTLADKEQAISVMQNDIRKLEEELAVRPTTASAPDGHVPPPAPRPLTVEEHLLEAKSVIDQQNAAGSTIACPEFREASAAIQNALDFLGMRESARRDQGVIDPALPHVSGIR